MEHRAKESEANLDRALLEKSDHYNRQNIISTLKHVTKTEKYNTIPINIKQC